jgi:cell wall-associated NlpC family hydrolase
MDEQTLRAAVIAEARTWLHTPWRHCSNVKGPNGAVDCAMLLAQVFINAGAIPPFDPRPYPQFHMLHSDEERLLGVVKHLGGSEVPLERAQPGDILLYRLGRVYSHGAILVEPQLVIHSWVKNRKVVYTETFDIDLAKREPRAFDMFAQRRLFA